MLYTEHDKLAIINLMNEAGGLSFDELGEILKERPANVIYCELDGKLYGIISMGDVVRADEEGKKAVKYKQNIYISKAKRIHESQAYISRKRKDKCRSCRG